MTLELSSTKDLIDEIGSRTTFAGVILYSDDEHLVHGQEHSRWSVQTSLDLDGTIQLLELMAEKLRRQSPQSQ